MCGCIHGCTLSILRDALQGRTQDLELGGAPVAYPGFQRGGCLRSGPIRKVGGGGGAMGYSII